LTILRVGDIVRLSGRIQEQAIGYIVEVNEKALIHAQNGSLQSLPYTVRWFDGCSDSGAAAHHLEKIE
jgi:hypothetical protein